MKAIGAIVLCVVFSINLVFGQQEYTTKSRRAIVLYENAIRSYQLMEYDDAIKGFGEALKADPEFIEAWLLLGQVFNDARKLEESVKAYRTAVSLDPLFYPNAFYFLAENEFLTGQYTEAQSHFSRFLSIGAGSKEMIDKSISRLKFCQFAIHAIAHPVPFEPVNLGENVNSEYDDYWPSLSADESIMVFTVLLPIDETNPRVYMNRQEDFFYSESEGGVWQPAKNAGAPLNTDNNEGAQTISSNGKFMVFTACNRPDGEGRCDLYYSEKAGDRWTTPKNFGSPINTPYSDKQPSLSADARTLYFISDRPGGKGGYDIWISTVDDEGVWGHPVNAGDSINTPVDEHSPFIHPDTKSLYFSSEGWPGLGRFDIFLSKKTDEDTWGTPVNLGYPINTHGNEEGLIVNARGDKAYYSSDGLGNRGRDIYEFILYEEARPVLVSYMKGIVFDAETKQRLEARFELTDLKTGEIIMKSSSHPQTGDFLVCIPANTEYALNVSKKGYLFYSDHFSIERIYERQEPFLKDIPLQPIKVGERIILRNVFYEYNKYDLLEKSRIELDKVVQLMTENPTLVVEISGHTDNTGTKEYNQGLSEKRAASVVGYLIEKGIAKERMTSKGYGLSIPIATNDTAEGRATNRRTEIKILEK